MVRSTSRRLASGFLGAALLAALALPTFAQPELQGTTLLETGPSNNDPAFCDIANFSGIPTAWVANYNTPGVAVYDLSVVPATQLTFIPGPSGFRHATDVDARDNAVAVTYFDPVLGGFVEVYDSVLIGTIIASFPVGPSTSEPTGIELVDNTVLIVADGGRHVVQGWRYNGGGTGTPTGPEISTPVSPRGPGLRPMGVEVATLGPRKFALVAEEKSDRIEAFPLTVTGEVRPGFRTVRTGVGPTRLYIEPSVPMIFVASPGDDTVTLVMPGNPPVKLQTGLSGPTDVRASVDFSGTLHLYIANSHTAKLAYYSGAVGLTPTFVGTFDTSPGPYGVMSKFGLPIDRPSGGGSIGDRIIVTSRGADAIDDFGR
jgi:hypothetical protein